MRRLILLLSSGLGLWGCHRSPPATPADFVPPAQERTGQPIALDKTSYALPRSPSPPLNFEPANMMSNRDFQRMVHSQPAPAPLPLHQ